jgi:hypothetical protein
VRKVRLVRLQKGEIQFENYIFSLLSTLIYLPIATELTSHVVHAPEVEDINFQENPYNGRQDIAEEVLCSASPVRSIIYRSH